MSFAASRWGTAKRTAADKRADLTTFLYSCRETALIAVTVDQLVARHGVERKIAEYELTIARQKRL